MQHIHLQDYLAALRTWDQLESRSRSLTTYIDLQLCAIGVLDGRVVALDPFIVDELSYTSMSHCVRVPDGKDAGPTHQSNSFCQRRLRFMVSKEGNRPGTTRDKPAPSTVMLNSRLTYVSEGSQVRA